jgi:hypothetical protein
MCPLAATQDVAARIHTVSPSKTNQIANRATDKTNEQAASKPGKLVVAVASRALFDLDESHGVFESEGEDAYARYQVRHEKGQA